MTAYRPRPEDHLVEPLFGALELERHEPDAPAVSTARVAPGRAWRAVRAVVVLVSLAVLAGGAWLLAHAGG